MVKKKKSIKRGRTPRSRYTVKVFKEGIKGSYGNVTMIAQKIGCERNTVYEWLANHLELREQLESEREKIVDLAESKLLINVNQGETSSIHFVLKTLGKSKGYVEKQILEHEGTLEHKIDLMSKEERKKRMKELRKKLNGSKL